MADEIKITLRLTASNGFESHTFNPTNLSFDQSAQGAISGVAIVNSSAKENLSIGDISTQGFLALRNISSTTAGHHVDWGTTGAMLGRIKPGEVALLRLKPATTLSWRASTTGATAIKVQYLLLEA